jgi:protein-arginine kinase activator protein McsA
MVWLRKRKHPESTVVQQCGRCKQRLGVVCLQRLATPNTPGHEMWLCAECARELRNDAQSS